MTQNWYRAQPARSWEAPAARVAQRDRERRSTPPRPPRRSPPCASHRSARNHAWAVAAREGSPERKSARPCARLCDTHCVPRPRHGQPGEARARVEIVDEPAQHLDRERIESLGAPQRDSVPRILERACAVSQLVPAMAHHPAAVVRRKARARPQAGSAARAALPRWWRPRPRTRPLPDRAGSLGASGPGRSGGGPFSRSRATKPGQAESSPDPTSSTRSARAHACEGVVTIHPASPITSRSRSTPVGVQVIEHAIHGPGERHRRLRPRRHQCRHRR